MRTKPFVVGVLGTLLVSAGVMTAHAQEGFYNPTNAASSSGKTTAHELFGTIGCPGRGLLDKPCEIPKEAPPPADSDGDGVIDSKDKCPGTPAGRKVNADGCELDSDGDGLVDAEDKCPTVYAKTADGCPLPPPPPAAVPKKLVLEGVNFDHDRAKLREDAFPILDKAAEGLKEWGDVKVEINGYTDSRGSAKYNLRLSQARAEAVRTYLIGKGISADRLTAKGYGESNPVADNKTEEGRFHNRRVELVEQK